MKYAGFKYDFTLKEFLYMVFNKKRCPNCGMKMKKIKRAETRTGKEVNSEAHSFFAPDSLVKHYIYFFRCESCEKEYSLNELVKINYKNN